MDISIRTATLDDILGMSALLSELFLIESDFSPDRHKQARGLALLINDTSRSSAVFVAEDARKIIGMCSVQTLISTAEGGPVGFVEDMIVHPDYRRMGTGSAIIAEIIKWCEDREMTRIQLLRDADNADAISFYTRNGWSDTRLVCMRKYV